MKNRMQMMIVMVAVFMTLGLQVAQSQRVVTATETTGLPHDFTTLTDSVAGQLCTANEDLTACFATSYMVPSALIDPNFQATGGAIGVNMFDNITSDNPRLLSDQLYLTVGPAINGMNLVTWCWDSDLEPNINICTPPAAVIPFTEPASGTMDLTNLFVGPVGILAAGQWRVTALSETPEPSTFLLVGSGLLALAGVVRRKLNR